MSRRRRLTRATTAGAAALVACGLAFTSSEAVSPPPTTLVAATVVNTWLTDPRGQAPCVEGRSRSASVLTESFERALPQTRFANGFARSTASGAADGSYAARVTRSGSGSSGYFFLPYVKVSAGTSTMLAFAHRGNAIAARNVVAVNSFGVGFPVSSTWGGATFDITATTRDEGGWLGTWFQHNVTSGVSTHLAIDNLQIFTCRPNATERIAGAGRYATAALVSERFAPGVPRVFIARGDNFPDALSVSALGAATDSPVLLTQTAALPPETRTALERLQPQEIVVLGNEGSVSEAVEVELNELAPVRRLGGDDRYATSALISGEFPAPAPVAFLSTGLNFADAMTGGALAGHRGGPMLLTRPDQLPETVKEELVRLQPSEIIVLGSHPTVTDAVLNEARQYAPNVRRIAGANRYETAALIAADFPTAVPHTYLSTGLNFPDGLTAGALAGSEGVPLLISQPTSLPNAVDTRLRTINEAHGYLLGLHDALSSLVRDQYGRTLP